MILGQIGGIDNLASWVYDAPKIPYLGIWGGSVTQRYEIGQKVIITPVREGQISPRDADLEPYAGKTGTISDYHWISHGPGAEVFHIYTVRIDPGDKDLVLHEDELIPLVV